MPGSMYLREKIKSACVHFFERGFDKKIWRRILQHSRSNRKAFGNVKMIVYVFMRRFIGSTSTLIFFIASFSFTARAQEDSKWNKYSISKSVNTSGLNYKKLFRGK